MDPPPTHAPYRTGFLRLVFFHNGVMGGRPASDITLRPTRHSTCLHNGGVSAGFARCPSTGELGNRCASRPKRTRSDSCRQVSMRCLTPRRWRHWSVSSQRIELPLSWHRSTGTRFALSTKRAEPGLFLLKCNPAPDRERSNYFEEIRRRGLEGQPSAEKRFARTPPRYFDCAPALPDQQHSRIRTLAGDRVGTRALRHGHGFAHGGGAKGAAGTKLGRAASFDTNI